MGAYTDMPQIYGLLWQFCTATLISTSTSTFRKIRIDIAVNMAVQPAISFDRDIDLEKDINIAMLEAYLDLPHLTGLEYLRLVFPMLFQLREEDGVDWSRHMRELESV